MCARYLPKSTFIFREDLFGIWEENKCFPTVKANSFAYFKWHILRDSSTKEILCIGPDNITAMCEPIV
jgi:hypothetical protein